MAACPRPKVAATASEMIFLCVFMDSPVIIKMDMNFLLHLQNNLVQS
jgi:hypothetical protein